MNANFSDYKQPKCILTDPEVESLTWVLWRVATVFGQAQALENNERAQSSHGKVTCKSQRGGQSPPNVMIARGCSCKLEPMVRTPGPTRLSDVGLIEFRGT